MKHQVTNLQLGSISDISQCDICGYRKKYKCEPHHRMEMRLLKTCPIFNSASLLGTNSSITIRAKFVK